MDIGTIVDRVTTLAQAAPFYLTPNPEPFGPELRPQQALDGTVSVRSRFEFAQSWLGMRQEETHHLTITIARTVKRRPDVASADVRTLCNSLAVAVIHDGLAADYDTEVAGWDMPDPGPDDDHVLGLLDLRVNFERSL